MRVQKWFLSAAGGLCLTFGVWADSLVVAKAAIVLMSPNADFGAAPYTIDFGGGAATYTFTDIYDPSTDPLTVAAVSTGGSAMVNSFLGQPIAFQEAAVIGATGYAFSPLTTPSGIPYSIAQDSIGLAFSLSDGLHYGFVTTLGPKVILYGYDTTPGGFITVGVPEPATWIMLIAGFGVIAASAAAKATIKQKPA
jgi:hypothetical protein